MSQLWMVRVFLILFTIQNSIGINFIAKQGHIDFLNLKNDKLLFPWCCFLVTLSANHCQPLPLVRRTLKQALIDVTTVSYLLCTITTIYPFFMIIYQTRLTQRSIQALLDEEQTGQMLESTGKQVENNVARASSTYPLFVLRTTRRSYQNKFQEACRLSQSFGKRE